jgi:hypothetical protein
LFLQGLSSNLFILGTAGGKRGKKPSPPRDCNRDEIRRMATDPLGWDWEGAESRKNESQETSTVPPNYSIPEGGGGLME